MNAAPFEENDNAGTQVQPVGWPMSLPEVYAQVRLTVGHLMDDRLYVVSDGGTAMFVQQFLLEEVDPDGWNRVHERCIEVSHEMSVLRTYVFAVSVSARRSAEDIRPLVEATGTQIVHADATGCRIAVPPGPVSVPSDPETPAAADAPGWQEDTDGDAGREWVSLSVRDQRVLDLLAVRSALSTVPTPEPSPLSPVQMARVSDAFSDPGLRVRCLTWIGEDTEQLWASLSTHGPQPERAIATWLLAGLLHQRGDRAGAIARLRVRPGADLLGMLAHTPEDLAATFGVETMRLWSHPLAGIVVRFIAFDLSRHVIAMAVDRAMADLQIREQRS